MPPINRLSNREWDVVGLLLQGKSNKLIAAALGISERTVEFHLKNVYAKFEVSSRIELVLKLGHSTGGGEIGELRSSTVARRGQNAENRDRRDPRMDWATSFKDAVPRIGEELEMKSLFSTKHVPVGAITAIFTGLLWVAMFRYFVHMAPQDIQAWIVPLLLVWAILGFTVGGIAKSIRSSLPRLFFSVLFATGLSPIAILPLMGFVVLPVAKLAEWLGLIDPASMSRDLATTLAISAMLGIWLVLGSALGALLLFLGIRRPEPKLSQLAAPEQRS